MLVVPFYELRQTSKEVWLLVKTMMDATIHSPTKLDHRLVQKFQDFMESVACLYVDWRMGDNKRDYDAWKNHVTRHAR